LESFFTDTKPWAVLANTTRKIISWRAGVMHLIIMLAIFQCIIAFFSYDQTLTFDEAMWQYIGRNWFRNGLTPYTGGVDNKSPLFFALYGLSDRLFGVNLWFPRIMGVCFQSAGIYYLYKITGFYSGKKAGILCVLIYGLSLLWNATGGKYVSYTESFSVAFGIAAFYFAIAENKINYIFLSGILCGLCIAFRLTGFFTMLAISITLVILKKNALAFIAGALLCTGLILLLLYVAGINLHDVYMNAFADNFSSGSVTDHSFSWRSGSFVAHFFQSQLIIFLPFTVLYFFNNKINVPIIIWLAFSLTGISIIGLYANQHFKDILPALSLLTTFAIMKVFRKLNISYGMVIFLCCIVFFPKSSEPFSVVKDWVTRPAENINFAAINATVLPSENEKKSLGLWIRSNTNPNDKVLVAGFGAVVQAYSERVSPSIYFNATQTPVAKAKFREEVLKNKPVMILIPVFPAYANNVGADMRSFIQQVADRDYILQQALYGYSIYKKK
jgi:4-amino-4-deoxy-L-arabinose transferase-like glycosyltransferase